ncbi:beta-lactamase [Thalassoporum mexicanum PCC 7367]|uniref:serine hydrolase n=1 Tax=Thalassoporum mexicanum TaxID=3457544 RepID=UPI00029FD055|nr:serine hydrolase [Pseudanabaena sp. PCC 7367]AFY68843.1 beta-lactamase [Pseudanabaena sp. PCC 7367]
MFLSQDNTRRRREERLKRLRDRRKKIIQSSPSQEPTSLNGASSGSVTPLRPVTTVRSKGSNNSDKSGSIKAVAKNSGKVSKANRARPSRTATSKSAPRAINGRAGRNFKQPTGPEVIIRIVLLQLFKLAVAGIGISVIVGTLISFWNSYSAGNNGQLAGDPTEQVENQRQFIGATLGTEATELKAQINQLTAAEPDLGLQALLVNIDTESYVNINADVPIAAASTIKLPLLVAFLQDVDAGKIRLDEQLEISEDVRVGHAGELQYTEPGTTVSALETITLMITISDNTATNMVIKRLGGAGAVNERFASWGLNATVIRNPLPDLEGTNTTSPQDLVNLLAMVDQGKLIAPRSRDRFMDITRRTLTDTLLPQGIGPEARIAHKTGDIASVVGDAGIIDMPNGRRYIMAALVQRPDNDQRANDLIRQVSDATYQHFKATTPPPAPVVPDPAEAIDSTEGQDPNQSPSAPTDSTTPTTENGFDDGFQLQVPANLVPGNSIAIPNN